MSLSVTFQPSSSWSTRPQRTSVTYKKRRSVSSKPAPLPPPGDAFEVDDLLLGEEAPADVQFTTSRPKEMKPRTWYTVLTYVHLPNAAGEVHKDSGKRLRSHAAESTKGMGKATTVIKRGTEIEIVPDCAGLPL